ncbi:MAG: hypothetical protein CXR30_08605 [Geobacter sp.]|nr:MAG: hypothetical protein CXR30_08605 [Geobacter sp.]
MDARKLKKGIMVCLFVLAMTSNSAWGDNKAVTNFEGYGTGNVAAMNAVNDKGFVTVTYAGEGNATVLGKFAFDANLAVRWDTPLPNGSGGYCAPASGYSTHSLGQGNTLSMNFSGVFCEVNQATFGAETKLHVPAPPFAFTGTFLIADGTGRLSGISGSGSMTGNTDENLKLTVIIDGKIVH